MMGDNDTVEEIRREVKNAIHGLIEGSGMHEANLGRAEEFVEYYGILKYNFDEEVRNIRSIFGSTRNKGILAYLELLLGYRKAEDNWPMIAYILRENEDPLVDVALKKCRSYVNGLRKKLEVAIEGKENALISANEKYQNALKAFEKAFGVLMQHELAAISSERKKRNAENAFDEATEELSNAKAALSSAEIDQKIALETLDVADGAFTDSKNEFALTEKKQREEEKALSEATEDLSKAKDVLMSTEKKNGEAEEALNSATKNLNEVEVSLAHAERKKDNAEESLNRTVHQMNKHAFISNGDYGITNTFDEDLQSLQKNADNIASARDALKKTTEDLNRTKDLLAPAEEKKRDTEKAFAEISKDLSKAREVYESAERRKKEVERILEKATNDLNVARSIHESAQEQKHNAEKAFSNINENLNKLKVALESAEKKRKDAEKDLANEVQKLDGAKETLESAMIDHGNIKKNLDKDYELIICSRHAAMLAEKDLELFFQNTVLDGKEQGDIMEIFNKEVDAITKALEEEAEMAMNSLKSSEFTIEVSDKSHADNTGRRRLGLEKSKLSRSNVKYICMLCAAGLLIIFLNYCIALSMKQ